MSGYRLLKHRQYDRSTEHLPDSIRRKALWAQVLLGTRGRTPSVKATTGYNARWRRTPVQGYHYYLWWIPLSESELGVRTPDSPMAPTILVHSIRHHDETDDPIALTSLDEFEEVSLASLDPRFDEQSAVSRQVQAAPIVPATVKGLPGSGKTVALFYLVRDLVVDQGLEHLLYITYTGRLKRAAREFLSAQAPELAQRVHVRTLAELEKELTGLPAALDPMSELADFRRFLEMQPASSLGLWRRHPSALYTEIRAYILGRTFPAGYPLPKQRMAEAIFHEDAWDIDAYAAGRGLPRDAAGVAARLAERLQSDRFFLDQVAARRALAMLYQRDHVRKLPGWLRHIDGLVVDEVQDLTLLQIAFLAEIARLFAHERTMAVVVAGDESQIVQPSGFDWGVTKDLLREVLGANPQEFEFRHQRRSPRNLAYVIDNAWNFYGRLPKSLRPSANRQSFLDDSDVELSVSSHRPDANEENGRLLICPLPTSMQQQNAESALEWRTFVEELAELPGRAVIDLSGALAPLVGAKDGKAEEVIFHVREIKGLERNTVILLGLNEHYQQAMRLADSASDLPALLDARRLIDEMRVALSRSTDKLIFLEQPNAAVLEALAIDNVTGHYTITWSALRDLLHTEQMSEIEVIEGYLDEVDDLIERARWDQARSRNRRAYEFALQLGDRALQREAQAQYIQIFIQEAAMHLLHDRLNDALLLNQQARTLAAELGDPAAIDEADEQYDTLRSVVTTRTNELLARAKEFTANPTTFYQQLQSLDALVTAVKDDRLLRTLDEVRLAVGWRMGLQLAAHHGADASGRLAALFAELAEVMTRQHDQAGAALAATISQRYAALPPADVFTEDQLATLLHFIDEYMQTIASLSLERDAYAFVGAWLEESFGHLRDRSTLYYEWAVRAERYNQLAGYPELDDRLWDLEKRVELAEGPDWVTASHDSLLLRFGAFIAAYNGNPHDASIAWEKLGELDLAIYQARAAGDLERAYNLMRQTGQNIPDVLSTAVKMMRQMAQIIHKQHSLSVAERRALAAQLTHLLASLDLPADDGEEYTAPAGSPAPPADIHQSPA